MHARYTAALPAAGSKGSARSSSIHFFSALVLGIGGRRPFSRHDSRPVHSMWISLRKCGVCVLDACA